MLINAGVEAVVFRGGDYPDRLAVELMEEAGLRLKQWECGGED